MLFMSKRGGEPSKPSEGSAVATTQPANAIAIDAGVAAVPTKITVDAAVAIVQTPIDAGTPEATHPDAGVEQIVQKKPVVKPITKDPIVTPPVEKGPPGHITIDSTPVYAVIFIDGKRYGETPLVNISLPPGKHSVRAVSPSGTSRNLSISIESGKTAPVRRIEW